MKDLEVRWIVEKDILNYTDDLINYLKEKGIYYKETNYQEILSHSYSDKYGNYLDDVEIATIFVGSLRLAKEINRYPIYPGAICNLKNFDCLNYPSWNDYLLNKDWTITVPPILKRHCREGDTTKKFFYRPNEGDKVFTGGLFTKSEVVKLELEDNKVIIQASKKEIVCEYRFLVVDNEIVDYTKYLDSLKDDRVYQGAKLILENALCNPKIFLPDRAFTVDIGYSFHAGMGVIELNSFSCANLYSMNMGKVVPAINDLAKEMYIQNND